MIDWQNFQFLRPMALVGILILPLLAFLLFQLKKQHSNWYSILPVHLQASLLINNRSYHSQLPYLLLTCLWILACIAFAGPTWEKLPQPVYQNQSGKVLVLDMSLSMRSNDIVPDRLTRARFKALDLLNLIDDGEVGLVAYAGDAFTISPLTADVENIKNLIPALSPEIMPVAGSNPYPALIQAKELLTNAAYDEGELYWITDGIDYEDVELIREFARQTRIKIAVLLIGTEQGAPIQQLDGSLLKDQRGSIVIPKLDPNLFHQALGNTDARIISMSADDSDLKAMKFTDTIFERQAQVTEEQKTGDLYRDMGAHLLLIALPFVALLFRKGLVLSVVFCLFLLPNTELHAEEKSPRSLLQDLFLNQNQLAKRDFEDARYNEAQQQFTESEWKAAAAYKAGDFESAAKLYSQLEGIDNVYNLGNTQAQMGALEAALESYNKVLEKQPSHENAAHNKAIIEDLLAQQEAQDEKQEQDSSQQEQDNSQQEQDNSQQEQDNSQQAQDNSQQAQDNSQQAQDNSQQEQDSSQQEQDSSQQEQDNSQQQQDSSQQEQAQSEQASPEPMRNESLANDDEQTLEQKEAISQDTIDPSQLSPEEREKLQKMQMLMNKIPDDPAFLLKRKMLLESQMRKRQGAPMIQQKDW